MVFSTDDNIKLLIRYMARDGYDAEEISKRLNIKLSQLKKIIEDDEEINRDLEYAKMLTDYRVEDMLLKRALGTTVTETKETDKGNGIETITNTKEIQGDTTAIQFWLKNRCPEKWNEKSASNADTVERLDKIFKAIDKRAAKEGRLTEQNGRN